MRYFLLAFLLCFSFSAQAADLSRWLAQRLDTITPQAEPAFIASYDTLAGASAFDSANENAAYTYDQALAICAFLADGDTAHARRIGDGLVWAQDHDRFYRDGRLRNAYAAGLVVDNPVKLPGYYKDKWIEDGYQVGSATGNNAWAGIALMRLFLVTNDQKYADAARRLGHFLIQDVGAEGGLRGGFEDFETNPTILTWRSTEHNTDALALFRLLQKSFPRDGFGLAVADTGRFVQAMWSGQRFEVGTIADGVTINSTYSALDAQILPLLALGREANLPALDYAEHAHGVPGGFDYTDKHDGIWVEGSAQVALLYRTLGQAKKADALIAQLERDTGPDGGVYAITGTDRLSTGLQLGNGGKGDAWSYYRRVAVAPAAWLIMAEKGYNPLAAP